MRFPFRRNPDARLREVMAELDAFHARGGQDAPRTFASVACREQHFRMPLYRYWCDAIRERPRFHRKQWEYVYICQSLHARGRLAPGMRGLGFGVGREPLVALFASLGAEVLATDLERSRAENLGWAETNQHSASIDELNDRGICPPGDFRDRVAYRDVDMNAIPGDLTGVERGVNAAAAARSVALTADPRLATLSAQLAEQLGPGGEPPEAELDGRELVFGDEGVAARCELRADER